MLMLWFLMVGGSSATLNADFIEGLEKCGDFMATLFQVLPDTLVVYPTENYYYFRMTHCGREYKGNLNFSLFYPEPEVRLVYESVHSLALEGETYQPEREEHVYIFTPDSGLVFTRLDSLLYRVSIPLFPRPLLVRFVSIPQTPPSLPDLKRYEYIFRTMDESGLMFLLVYDREAEDFVWFLSDTQFVPVPLRQVGNDPIYVHERSGFVFVKTGPLYMLVGVPELNRVMNNWYDGPFDQLNDRNWNPRLSDILRRIARQHWQTVDSFGFYVDKRGRYLIAPYFLYITADELLPALKACVSFSGSPSTMMHCVHKAKVENTRGRGASKEKP